MSKLSRRDFLKLARNGFLSLSAGLTIAGLIRFFNFESNPDTQTEYDLGPASNSPLNSHTVISEPPVLVIHNENGFGVLSLLCTHLGCTVKENAQGFECPCHGSCFNADGMVQNGPAKAPLRSLQIQLTDQGHLRLFTV